MEKTQDRGAVVHRLNELWRGQPADATLQNLLAVLSAKLDLCSRLPVFEFEATTDGNDACASVFRALADGERDSFNEVADCLRAHLDATLGAQTASAGAIREMRR